MFQSKSSYEVKRTLDYDDHKAVEKVLDTLVDDYNMVRKAYATLARAVNAEPGYQS